MNHPDTYTASICGHEIILPVVPLQNTSIHIALADTLGDWQLCDLLAGCLLERAAQQGISLQNAGAILSAGKAVTLAESLARKLGTVNVALAEKADKNFWPDTYAVPSRSITSGKDEQLVVGGRRAAMLKSKEILVVDDVISTGQSIRALAQIGAHFGRVMAIAAPFIEGHSVLLPESMDGYPLVTLAGLPIWGNA